jgi:hypothetical protein
MELTAAAWLGLPAEPAAQKESSYLAEARDLRSADSSIHL